MGFLQRFKNFREITGVLKDIGWWLASATAAALAIYSFLGKYATSAVAYLGATILLFYAVVRVIAYRRKVKRMYRAMGFTHDTCHLVRDTLGKEMAYFEAAEAEVIQSTPPEALEEATSAALQELLQKILNNTSYAFRELTGRNCTAVLLMPQKTEADGWHFLTTLYSSDTSNERIEAQQPHKGGLVKQAFESNEALHFPDLSKELKKGNFVKARDDEDPFRWYRSAMMAHFKVQGARWGILSVDSTSTGAFSDDYKSFLCSFSDALAIAFSLAECGDLGNSVYDQKE
jgi:hypothetical protein